jgi:hypothetical protein
MNLIARMGDQVESVLLNVWNEVRKKREYLATIPAEQFSLDYVRDTYGPGDYIAVYLDGKGLACGGGAFSVSDRGMKKDAGPAPASAPAPAPERPALDPTVAAVLGQLSGQTKGLELLVQSQAAMMQGLLSALGATKGSSSSEALDVGLRIAEIVKGATAAPTPRELVADLAESFREGMRLGQVAGGGEKGFADVIDALVPPVTKVLESVAAQPKTPPPAATPAVPATPTAPAVAPAGGNPMGWWDDLVTRWPPVAALSPFVREALVWAQRGWDAAVFADTLLARLPEPALDQLAELLAAPGAKAAVLARFPDQLAAYKPWFEQMLDALIEGLTAPPEGAEPSGEVDGHA